MGTLAFLDYSTLKGSSEPRHQLVKLAGQGNREPLEREQGAALLVGFSRSRHSVKKVVPRTRETLSQLGDHICRRISFS